MCWGNTEISNPIITKINANSVFGPRMAQGLSSRVLNLATYLWRPKIEAKWIEILIDSTCLILGPTRLPKWHITMWELETKKVNIIDFVIAFA